MDNRLIREELKASNYNLSRVSRTLGVDYALLQRDYGIKIEPIIRPSGPPPADIRELGKPGMESFVIAIKAHGDGWPVKYHNVIQEARSKYDSGTHEMCQQKRPDGWIVLYLIPRVRRIEREPYFFSNRSL